MDMAGGYQDTLLQGVELIEKNILRLLIQKLIFQCLFVRIRNVTNHLKNNLNKVLDNSIPQLIIGRDFQLTV